MSFYTKYFIFTIHNIAYMKKAILLFTLILSGIITAHAQTLRMDQVPKVASA
jgi:hypothetical protein